MAWVPKGKAPRSGSPLLFAMRSVHRVARGQLHPSLVLFSEARALRKVTCGKNGSLTLPGKSALLISTEQPLGRKLGKARPWPVALFMTVGKAVRYMVLVGLLG